MTSFVQCLPVSGFGQSMCAENGCDSSEELPQLFFCAFPHTINKKETEESLWKKVNCTAWALAPATLNC